MLVKNSVSHDARVLKEAVSLSESGFKVSVIGIRDNRNNQPFNKINNNFSIYRVAFRGLREKIRLNILRLAMTLVSMLFILLLLSIILFTKADNLNVSLSQYMGALNWGNFIKFIIIAIVSTTFLLLVYRFVKLLKKQKQIFHNYQKSDLLDLSYKKKTSFIDNIFRFIFLYENMIAIDKAMYVKLRELKPDIVHCHDLNTLKLGYTYRKKFNTKLVYDSHEIFEEQPLHSPISRVLYKYQQKKYSSGVDVFITINASVATFLRKRYPKLSEANIIMNATSGNTALKNNLMRDKIAEIYEDQSILAHQSGNKNVDFDIYKKNILLFQGGFAQHRGLDMLIRAAADFNNNWVLVMMGWGNYETHLKFLAESLMINNTKVFFLPPVSQNELKDFSAGADAGIIPYENTSLNHYYCTPNKLWEYPASGLPLIVSPFPELMRFMEKYSLGWILSKPLTPESIAQTVNSINIEQLKEKRQYCYEFVKVENWKKYEEKLTSLYRKISTDKN